MILVIDLSHDLKVNLTQPNSSSIIIKYICDDPVEGGIDNE